MTDWPLSFKPDSQAFYVQTLTARFDNPYNGQVQVLERDGARWVTSLSLHLYSANARAFEAFLASLRGPSGEVLVPDFRRLAAMGSLAGNPQLVSGTGRTLVLSGFMHGAQKVLAAGDLIQASPGRTHMVVDDIAADASGNASIRVEPRLRESVVAGPLVTSTCRVRMRLISDDAGKNPTTPPMKSAYQLDLIEILTP